jgi:flavin-dependent dehydrogenase
MNVPKECDVVVIGGGPGGSLAATLLAQKGYQVVLVDKKRHPRYAVGESVIPHMWKYLKLSGADQLIKKEDFIVKAGGTVVWKGKIQQTSFKPFGYKEPALHVERDRFDHLLIQFAREQGAQVFEEVEVKRVDLGDGTAKNTIVRHSDGETACRYLVDASGQAAIVSRQLGTRVVDDGFRFMSVWGYYDDSLYVGIDGRAHDRKELRTTLTTTFVSEIPGTGGWGWMWHIPLRESTSIGLVVPRDAVKELRLGEDGARANFDAACRAIPRLDRLLKGAKLRDEALHVTRDYSYYPKEVSGPSHFLIGDAAAFTDPIFSIGVVLAMYGGFMASWAIDRSLRNPDSARRSREIYSGQLRDRIELSRSFALPRYANQDRASDRAKEMLGWESDTERELMQVVTEMTTRSENYREMVGELQETDKIWEIPDIEFPPGT